MRLWEISYWTDSAYGARGEDYDEYTQEAHITIRLPRLFPVRLIQWIMDKVFTISPANRQVSMIVMSSYRRNNIQDDVVLYDKWEGKRKGKIVPKCN